MRIGRLFGIEIRIDLSWLVAFAFVTWSLASGLLPSRYPGLADGAYLAAGAVGALLLFGSVLGHELAHAAVARWQGMRVTNITLFIFGGMAGIATEPRRAWDEFRMAIAGPLASVAIGALAFGLARILPASPLRVVIGYMAYANVALAVFNMLPGFPLDGGRVFRSILWGLSGRKSLSTRIAATSGQVIGWGLVALAAYTVVQGAASGIWIGLTAYFIIQAAGAAKRDQWLQDQFAGVTLRRLVAPEMAGGGSVVPGTSLAELARDHFAAGGRSSVPVMRDGEFLGVVRLSDARRVAPFDWPFTSVQALMRRETPPSMDIDASLSEAVELLQESGSEELVVTDAGAPAGLLDRAAIGRFLDQRLRQGSAPRPRMAGMRG